MTAPYPGASTFTLSYGPYTDARGNVQFVGMTGKLTPVDPGTGRPISLVHGPSGQVLVPTPLTVTIAADGTSSVGPIAHTDDATLSPQGWAYQMSWDASSQAPNPGSRVFYAPLSVGSTLDYDQTVTPSLLPPAAAQPVTSVVGYTGAVTGAQLAADPAVRAAYAAALVPTATKTASYTAAVNDLAMMNVAGGATALTLPTAPADKARVGYRAIGATVAAPLTINRGGSTDTIGIAGATSTTITLADETVVLQYDAPNTRWLAVSNIKTMASQDARYSPIGASLTRLRMVAFGDSTVAGGMRDPNNVVVQVGNAYSFPHPGLIGEEWAGPQSWATHAALRSGGRLLLVHNAGVASDTSAGCLARFQTDVVAWKPDILLASFGAHNSINGGEAVATTRSNIVTMIRMARAAGIEPILVTCYPENLSTIRAQIRQHNAWLKTLAAGRDPLYPDISRLMVVDPYAAVVDPTSSTGAWVSSYTADGTHATPAAALIAGDKILADMAGLLRGNVAAGPYAAVDNVQGSPNLFTNGLMLTDVNADGRADNWTGNGTGVTWSLVTDSAVIGKAQQAVIASSTASFYQQQTVDGTIIKVGDKLKWAGWAKVTAAAGSLNWNMILSFPGVASYQIEPMSQIVGVDYSWFYYECEAIVPAGATILRAGIYTYGGTGTLWLAQQQLINMSTGLAY